MMSLDRLALLEQRIERNVADVGAALAEIRDQRLYRAQYGTFEDYCQTRWGWGANYARKMITASEVQAQIGTIVPEGVTRELVPLRKEPERLQAAWQEAQERAEPTGKPPTAAIVRQVVRGDTDTVVVRKATADGAANDVARALDILERVRVLPEADVVRELRGSTVLPTTMAATGRWLLRMAESAGQNRLEVVK